LEQELVRKPRSAETRKLQAGSGWLVIVLGVAHKEGRLFPSIVSSKEGESARESRTLPRARKRLARLSEKRGIGREGQVLSDTEKIQKRGGQS